MKKCKKKAYVRPVSTYTRVVLESPICADSDIRVQAPHDANGIDAQEVDTDFSNANNFTANGKEWQ